MHRHTPDIVAEHLDELPSDCARRAALLIDQRAFPTHLRALDGIIGARMEGIALAGSSAAGVLRASAASEDPAESCAATMCLLESGTPSAWTSIVEGLETGARGWPGIAKALAWTTIEPPIGALRGLADSTDPVLSVVGLVGLAARGDALDHEFRVSKLAADPDPGVRSHAYLAAGLAMLGLGRGSDILVEPDPAVRRLAFQAAAWSAEPWLLEGRSDHPDALACVAALVSDLVDDQREAFVRRCLDPELGTMRFDMLASYGHPCVVPIVLDAMASADAVTAVAAGAAFSRMFGVEIDSERSHATSAGPDDDFERAFVEELPLPDAELAHRIWHDVQPSLASAGRIASGMDVGRPFDAEALDLRSRREWGMRRAYAGGGGIGWGELERVRRD